MKAHLIAFKGRYIWGMVVCVLTGILGYFGIDQAELDHLMETLNQFINELLTAMETPNDQ